MAFTQILRRRPPCLLHVEPLEIRYLLTGQSPWQAAPLALTSDLGATALVSQPTPLSLTLDNQATAADSSDPATTDNSSSTGDIQTTSPDNSSPALTDSSSTQGDASQAASDQSAGASGQDSSAGDPTTGQAQDSSVKTALNPIQAVQSTVVSTINPIVGQTVTATPIPDVTAISSTVVPINPNSLQGGDSGSGTGGDDSGSSGGDSGSSVTGDPGTGTNLQTTPINPGSRAANVVTRVEGPEPARSTPNNSGENTAANTGNNPAPNPGDSGPATPPAVANAAPKPADDAAPRLSSVLIQAEAAKAGQRIVASLDVSSAHTDSSRPAEARETGEGTGDKQAEGVKGNFTVEEAPPPAAESETPIARAQDIAPNVEEPDAGPMETPALVRDLPSAGATLLAAAAPFDLPALEKGVHGFFAQLEQMGEQIVAAQDRTGVGPWLVALATAGIALEVARRKLKPTPSDLDSADGGSDPTWNWLVAPDPG